MRFPIMTKEMTEEQLTVGELYLAQGMEEEAKFVFDLYGAFTYITIGLN